MAKDLFNHGNQYEQFQTIWDGKPAVLHADSEKAFSFQANPEQEAEYTFRFTGNVGIPAKWRSEFSVENEYHVLYRRLSESLEAVDGAQALRMANTDAGVARCAYYKVYADEAEATGAYTFSIRYKTSADAALEEVKATVEVFYQKEQPLAYDRATADVSGEIVLERTQAWREQTVQLMVEQPVDFIVISVMGLAFTGEILLFSPALTVNGRNVVQPFTVEPRALVSPRWIGENLSKIEWPHFDIEINGTQIFSGESFDRIYQSPAHEFKIPQGVLCTGANTATVTYRGTYADPYDYELTKVELVARPAQGIIAYDRFARPGVFPVLVKTSADGQTVRCYSGIPQITPEVAQEAFDRRGLHVVRFHVDQPFTGGGELTVEIGGSAYPVKIARYLEKDDTVVTGTGDSVYIDLNMDSFGEYLAWYYANNIGNMLTLRTTYRWSGCQNASPEFWAALSALLDGMGTRYCIMTDGRELNSAKTNGQGFTGESPLYGGRQSHEQDGAFYYWMTARLPRGEEFFNELTGRRFTKEGMLPCGCVVRRDGEYYKHYDNTRAQDMQQAAAYFQENIARVRADSRRHTGPSVLFKYFYQTGVEWLGAELMYGTHSITNAALRGASRAYGKSSYGGHLAIQWSNAPHQSPYRYRRYLYSLYTCYMNGLDQINTEEGLWRFESYNAKYERNSTACLNHAGAQAIFTDFVKTHSRRGELKPGIAFVQGKYDGFALFTNGNVWGRDGWAYDAPEKSWAHMKTFYPGGRLRSVYVYPCFPVQQGFFTSTPYGEVDITPAEAAHTVWSGYRTLIMAGWNTADADFAARLRTYAEQGGTVLLTWAHLFTTVKREEALDHSSPVLFNADVQALTGIASADFNADTPDVTLSTGIMQNGYIENHIGKGRVLLVNSKCYPSEKPVEKQYRALVKQLAQENEKLERRRGWVSTKDWVQTAVYDAPDRRTFYLLDIRWWRRNPAPAHAELYMGDAVCRFPVKRDVLNVLTLFPGLGVLTADHETDIISYQDGALTLQGSGKTKLVVFQWQDGEISVREKTLLLNGICTEKI